MDTQVWWIEHDVPPFDRYQCAAYGVELSVRDYGQPILTIRDGFGDHTFIGPAIDSLEKNILAAARHPAMIIPRKFGPADE